MFQLRARGEGVELHRCTDPEGFPWLPKPPNKGTLPESRLSTTAKLNLQPLYKGQRLPELGWFHLHEMHDGVTGVARSPFTGDLLVASACTWKWLWNFVMIFLTEEVSHEPKRVHHAPLPVGDVSSRVPSSRGVPVVSAQQHHRAITIPVSMISPQEVNLRLATLSHPHQGRPEILIKTERT